MMKFCLKEFDRPAQDFQFVGFRNDRNALFLFTPSEEKRCLLPYVAVPKNGRLKRDPFPECAPVEIRPCRLLPPPCRASAEDAATENTAIIAAIDSPWELIDVESLWPEPGDDLELLKRLEQFKAAQANEYEAKKKA